MKSIAQILYDYFGKRIPNTLQANASSMTNSGADETRILRHSIGVDNNNYVIL